VYDRVLLDWKTLTQVEAGQAQSGQGYYPASGQCASTVRGGIACSALGSLINVGACDLLATFQCIETLQKDLAVTACLPVFTSNPITCSYAGVSAVYDGYTVKSIVSSSCSISTVVAPTTGMAFHPIDNNSSLIGVCTSDRPVGEATVLFADYLLNTRLVQLFDPSLISLGDSAIECNISVNAQHISFQKVTLLRDIFFPGVTDRYGYYINGTGETCDPAPAVSKLSSIFSLDASNGQPFERLTNQSQALTDRSLAAAVFSITKHLENSIEAAVVAAEDSLLTYNKTTGRIEQISFVPAFPGSTNSLEDYLGVT